MSHPVSRMAGLALGALGFTLAAFSGASAQYYPPPGYYGAPPPGYYGGPPPGYYGDGYYRRRVPMGSVCVTSRGECSYGRPVPMGSLCKCHIPGFGPKRGTVQY